MKISLKQENGGRDAKYIIVEYSNNVTLLRCGEDFDAGTATLQKGNN